MAKRCKCHERSYKYYADRGKSQLTKRKEEENANTLLRNRLRVRHLIDELDDDVLFVAFKEVASALFGGIKGALKLLASHDDDTQDIADMFSIIKQTNTEHQKDISGDLSPATTLSTLPMEMITEICGFLTCCDIKTLKMVSWRTGYVSLVEMSKIPVTIINANSMIDHHESGFSAIEFCQFSGKKYRDIDRMMKEIDDEISTFNKKTHWRIIQRARDTRYRLQKEKALQFDDNTTTSFMQSVRFAANVKLQDVSEWVEVKKGVPIEHQLTYRVSADRYLSGISESTDRYVSSDMSLGIRSIDK